MGVASPSVWRRLLSALITLAILGLLVWGFRPPPRLVDTALVRRGHLEQSLTAEGHTRVVERYRLSAPIAAELQRLRLEVGDWVEAGEVVARFAATGAPALDVRALREARAQVTAAEEICRAAEAAEVAAEAGGRFARAEFARLSALAGEGLVARAELEAAEREHRRAEAGVQEARARVAAARAELEAARARLQPAGEQHPAPGGSVELRAPAAGQVLARFVESRQVVAAGEAVLEIGDPRQLEVAIDVLSADAVRLSPGMRVWFERWGGDAPLEGQVRRIEPSAFTKVSALGVEEQRVWVIADFLAPPGQRALLGDGYRVDARFVLWEGDDRVLVPSSALIRRAEEGRGSGWSLFVIEQGRARERSVTLARRAAFDSEVREGVEVGERVILHPPRDLVDGVRVSPQRID